MSVFNTLGVEDGEQIEHKMLSSAIEKHRRSWKEITLESVKPVGIRSGYE